MYAEDDEKIKESTLRTFQIFFKNVYTAKDGLEALEIYKKTPIDVMILDYVMPYIDGHELAMEIRKTNQSIPIVIYSAFTDKRKLMNAIQVGAIQYLEKPFKFEDLISTMDQIEETIKKEKKLKVQITTDLAYDSINKTIIKKGDTSLSLSKKEILLVEYLLKKRSMLCKYEELSDEIFGENIDPNTLRNTVYRIQKKVELPFIITIKELGYMIV